MNAEKPRFIIDLDTSDFKPVPTTIRKRASKGLMIKLPDYYPKYEEEFFDTVKDCASYIDRLYTVDEKINYNNRLNRIFIIRDRVSLMRLFRELANAKKKEGDNSGKKDS
jgi:hypothetical protein